MPRTSALLALALLTAAAAAQPVYPPGYPGPRTRRGAPEKSFAAAPVPVRRAVEVLDAAVDAARKAADDAVLAAGGAAADALQPVVTKLSQAEKLDEAIVARDLMRRARAGQLITRPAGLAADAAPPVDAYVKAAAAARADQAAAVKAARAAAAKALAKMVSEYARAEKLDEALAARDALRAVRVRGLDVRPWDGFRLRLTPDDVGKVFYYDVDATQAVNSPAFGTDVYAAGLSGLPAAAVHGGALKLGERGVVKVTVLPGQDGYEASVRNGVASQSFVRSDLSFKVEPVGDDDEPGEKKPGEKKPAAKP